MTVRILLFAGLREKMGKSEFLLKLPQPFYLKDLKENLGLEEQTWNSLAFAVNQTYVPVYTELKEGDEVALIPPVAGG